MRDKELKPTIGQIVHRLLVYAAVVTIMSFVFFVVAVLMWPV